MIFCVDLNHLPLITGIVGCEDAAPRADYNGVFLVLHKDGRERNVERDRLPLPGKATVLSSKDRVVSADRKAGLLVFRKMDRVQRITLGKGILPRPALPAAELGGRG